jgi:SAM-dependent methyltransferase/uncharacterized protein YbaR (Trm112 family)
MRKELLGLLLCPNCEQGTWEIRSQELAGGGVARSGDLVCLACGSCYVVEDGILDLLPRPPESVLRERAGWERFLQRASEELAEGWILSLPKVDASVTSNAQSIAHWKRQADNFYRLVDLLDLTGRERVLEIGAGRCWASAHLARLGHEVVALDVVRGRAAGGLETGEVYLRQGTPYFDRVLASMEGLPFRPQSFDLVLSLASIHHSPDLELVAAESARVLKAGGRLAMASEPCISIFKEKRVNNLETNAGINEHTYNVVDYRRAFGRAGLKARYFIPGALVAMLEGDGQAQPHGFKAQVFGLARRAWSNPRLRRALNTQAANTVGLLLFEYGVTAVAEKPAGGEAR